MNIAVRERMKRGAAEKYSNTDGSNFCNGLVGSVCQFLFVNFGLSVCLSCLSAVCLSVSHSLFISLNS